MTYIERRGRVWGLIAEQAAARDRPVSAVDVCAAVVPAVQVTGAWLSAGLDAQAGHLIQVTDEVGRQLADLQLTLGEGPLLDASATSGPMLASELADEEWGTRWPAFAPAAGKAGAAAVFAFPLVVGAIRAGVLGLYRDRPGPLSDFQLGDALVFADTATLLLLNALTGLRTWLRTGRRSTRLPAWSPSSSTSASPTRSFDCGPMLMSTTFSWPMSPATS